MAYEKQGNQFLTIENEVLRTTFWLNKGADMIELRHKPTDVDVLWHTPMPAHKPGDYVAPATSSLGAFFDYYPGGWQEVFPNSHLPVNSYKNVPFGLHGEVCLLPWSYRVLEDTEGRLRIQLEVQTARTPFVLQKTIELASDWAYFYLHETIRNDGHEELAYNWGHHPTFGAPLLEEGAWIDMPEGSVMVTPGDVYSETARYANGQEQVWPHAIDVNEETVNAARVLSIDSRTSDSFHVIMAAGWVALRNPKLDLGISLAWNVEDFPFLWCWQGYGGNWGYPFYGRNYNLALEPFTNPLGTIADSLANGSACMLQPQEQKSTSLRVAFTSGTKPIANITVDGGESYAAST